jgi:hypothetical protein
LRKTNQVHYQSFIIIIRVPFKGSQKSKTNQVIHQSFINITVWLLEKKNDSIDPLKPYYYLTAAWREAVDKATLKLPTLVAQMAIRWRYIAAKRLRARSEDAWASRVVRALTFVTLL